MKQYPSITPGSKSGEFSAHVFDKPDGRNFRAEFSSKRGWYKFGSRHQMVGPDDVAMGPAIKLFLEQYGDHIMSRAIAAGHKKGVVFAEFWGAATLGGSNISTADTLTFFDFSPHGGIIGPLDFMRMFADAVPTPRYFGLHTWNPQFVAEVRSGKFDVFEGVVGKSSDAKIMAKAKTQKWIDAVISAHGSAWADQQADI